MNEIDKSGHGPGCPSPVGGDCDCRVEHDSECPARYRVYDVGDCTCGKTAEFRAETPAEVWCSKCPMPTMACIDGVALCAYHFGHEQGVREGLRAAAIARLPEPVGRLSCGWSSPACKKDAVPEGYFEVATWTGYVTEKVSACSEHAGLRQTGTREGTAFVITEAGVSAQLDQYQREGR